MRPATVVTLIILMLALLIAGTLQFFVLAR